ncbi:MAG: hypothetical protein M1551_06025 [Firmicutes bacterium]|nr:hypothetical protein [Bacillota bacterium]
MAATVGFLRAVKLTWMNKTAELVLEGKNPEEIRKELNEYLAFEIKSATTLRKTRDILMHTWVTPSAELAEIRKAALEAYTRTSSNRYALQYCMLLSAYPVIADICGLIGKLSTIQDEFTTAWLKEKMYEAWGERETIADSLKYILQSLRDFGVIVRPKIGTHRINVQSAESNDVVNVILMAILHLKERAYYEVSELSNIPQMFPFNYAVSLEWLHNSPKYVLNNYGGKMTVASR